jgi:hypothetical protein
LLPIAGKRIGLALAVLAARLPRLLPRLLSCTALSAQTVNLIANPREIVHSAIQFRIFRRTLGASQGACCVVHILAQLLQVAGQTRLKRIGKLAAAEDIRALLDPRPQIVLVHAFERAAQLAGSRRLRGSELTRRIAQPLGKVRQIIAHLLAIIHHFVDFLLGRPFWRLLAGSARRAQLGDQITHVVGLLLLPSGELVGRLGHRFETPGGILLLRTAESIGRLTQAVCGAARIGRTGILRSGALHVVVGLAKAVERLLRGLLTAVRSLLLG